MACGRQNGRISSQSCMAFVRLGLAMGARNEPPIAGGAATRSLGGSIMPQGDKSSCTSKQKRQAEHIEESYEEKGLSDEEAERRAWSTVNKQDGGGKQSGSGRKKSSSSKSAKDAPDRDSSATKGGAGTRPPADS